MNDGGKCEKPQPKPVAERAPSLARKIGDFQGECPMGVQGMAAMHAHKQKYFRGVEYRFSEGVHGEPPLANLGRERGAPIREHAGREQNARLMRKQEGEQGASTSAIPKGAGAPLPSGVRAKMEPKLGADLSGVRVHTGSDSAAAATSFGARAFTVGADVHFNAGQFSPGTKEGDRLIAHELTHVVQAARSGVQRKAEESDGVENQSEHLEVSDPDEPAEKEADATSDQVAEELHGEENSKDGKQTEDDGVKHPAEKRAPISAKLSGVGLKVFRTLQWDANLSSVNPNTNPRIAQRVPALAAVAAQANQLTPQSPPNDPIEVRGQAAGPGAIAVFRPQQGAVFVSPPQAQAQPQQVAAAGGQQQLAPDVLNCALSLAHELQHVVDYYQTNDQALRSGVRKNQTAQKIHSEYRAHANQNLASRQAHQAGEQVAGLHRRLHNAWTADTFDIAQAANPDSMFNRIKVYMREYDNLPADPADNQVQQFIQANQGWIAEAFGICPPTQQNQRIP